MKAERMEPAIVVLHGTVRAETPIHLGDGRHFGIVKQTKPYVSGAVLRGAFGVALIKAVCEKPEFMDAHESCSVKEYCPYFSLYREDGNKASRVIFRNAYPKHKGCVGGGVYVPAPRTLFTCEGYHERYNTYEAPLTCSKCGKPLNSFEGYVCSGCQHITRLPVERDEGVRRLTSTAIDRGLYTAAVIRPVPGEEGYGTLHSRDILPRGMEYDLTVVLQSEAEPLVNVVTNVLEKALPDEGLGGGKSRGLGKVSLRVDGVEKLTAAMLDRRAETVDSTDFSLRLVSDAVLEGQTLAPETLLAAARRAYTQMYREGAPALPGLTLEKQMVSMSLTSGWSLRENRRRDMVPVFAAGSMFRYGSTGSWELARALAALEYSAVGGFKPHGYGQVKVEHI